MKQIEYNLPIFTEKEKADLNLYSEKMAEAIKVQIDKFGNPIIFKGVVNSVGELNSLTDVVSGNIYRVNNENKNYIFNGAVWVEYSDNINIDILEKKSSKYKLILTENKTAGAEITIPCYYKVGADVLDVFLDGERLLLSSDAAGSDGHYQEVGTAASISNKIKTTTDWSLETGDVLELIVRGEYSVTEQ